MVPCGKTCFKWYFIKHPYMFLWVSWAVLKQKLFFHRNNTVLVRIMLVKRLIQFLSWLLHISLLILSSTRLTPIKDHTHMSVMSATETWTRKFTRIIPVLYSKEMLFYYEYLSLLGTLDAIKKYVSLSVL